MKRYPYTGAVTLGQALYVIEALGKWGAEGLKIDQDYMHELHYFVVMKSVIFILGLKRNCDARALKDVHCGYIPPCRSTGQ